MPSSPPSHAVRTQAEICLPLLRHLEATVAKGLPLDQQLAQYYRGHREFGSRDRRFFSALAFAWFRWRGWLPTPYQLDALNCVLAWLLDAPDMHPVIEHLAATTTLAPLLAGTLQAAVPLPLPDKARRLGELLKQPPPNIEALVPAWFAEDLFYPAGADRTGHLHSCLQAFQVRPPTWLRAAIGHEQDALARLQGEQLSATVHPSFVQAICLPTGCNREILNTLPDVELQDLASQYVGLVCAPIAGEHWWDACAGSGGKSFHLADLMQGKGSIVATDTRDAILDECRKRMIRNRAKTITLRAWNGTQAKAPDRLFDGVLVDAPCSGIGTWHRNPDARWRAAPDTVANHAVTQSNLLDICARRVRPGGRLVYAVCTLSGAETSGVIEKFLATRQDFSLEPTSHPITREPTDGLIWIWPWEGQCNGMFIARLKKR